MFDKTKPGIYCIRNTLSGRVYVGSSVKIASRWKTHRHNLRKGTHASIVLQRSWNLHGADSFSFEVLENVSDLTTLIDREQYWIDKLDAVHQVKGFNTRPKAGNQMGFRHSQETRDKMSASGIGKKKSFSDEHRAFLRAATIVRNKNPSHIEKMRNTKKGVPLTLETRLKQSAVRMGRKRPPFTEKHRANISAAKKGYKRSMGSRLKQSLTAKMRRAIRETTVTKIAFDGS